VRQIWEAAPKNASVMAQEPLRPSIPRNAQHEVAMIRWERKNADAGVRQIWEAAPKNASVMTQEPLRL
jgi:hypothetical protein